MKLKIITSTNALDNGKALDNLVNEFCKNKTVINIDCKIDTEGEIYCFIVYK